MIAARDQGDAVGDCTSAPRRHVDAQLDEVVAAEPVAEGELPGTLQHVAVAVRRPVVPNAVLAQPDADAGIPKRQQRQRLAVARCDGRERDVLRREQLDQGRLSAGVHRAEREGVTDRDQTLHPERRRAFGDQLERERAELSDLVEVDVDADSVPFGDAEDDVEMGDRITVVGARIEPADEVGACPHGGVEQVGGARVADDAATAGNAITCTSARPACSSRAASTPSSRSSPQSVST